MIFGGKALKGSIFPHEHEQDEEHGHTINGNVYAKLDSFLKGVKQEKKSEYLEQWRKNWMERMDNIINWAIQHPDNFPDVIAMLNKFEAFYGELVIIIVTAESGKEQLEDFRRAMEESENNIIGPEIR